MFNVNACIYDSLVDAVLMGCRAERCRFSPAKLEPFRQTVLRLSFHTEWTDTASQFALRLQQGNMNWYSLRM